MFARYLRNATPHARRLIWSSFGVYGWHTVCVDAEFVYRAISRVMWVVKFRKDLCTFQSGVLTQNALLMLKMKRHEVAVVEFLLNLFLQNFFWSHKFVHFSRVLFLLELTGCKLLTPGCPGWENKHHTSLQTKDASVNIRLIICWYWTDNMCA